MPQNKFSREQVINFCDQNVCHYFKCANKDEKVPKGSTGQADEEKDHSYKVIDIPFRLCD